MGGPDCGLSEQPSRRWFNLLTQLLLSLHSRGVRKGTLVLTKLLTRCLAGVEFGVIVLEVEQGGYGLVQAGSGEEDLTAVLQRSPALVHQDSLRARVT